MVAREQSTRSILESTYVQWLCSRKQVEFLICNTIMPDGSASARKEYMSARSTCELLSILERWHICEQFGEDDCARKMRSELIEKGLAAGDDHARAIVARFLNVRDEIDTRECDISTYTPRVMISACGDGSSACVAHANMPRTQFQDNVGFVSFGRFSHKFSPMRLSLMATMAASRAGCSTRDIRIIERITIAALCYNALVPLTQQWNIPPRAYDVMIQEYGATLEGFASPFNSQMMRYMMPNMRDADTRAFCSIFPRIDAPFGSVGSFFDESPATELCGRVSVLNPPFIEDILARTVKKCIADLGRATSPTRIFIIVPNWRDSPCLSTLTQCSYVERRLALPCCYYVDAMRADLYVSMHVSQSLFVLSRYCRDARERTYDDIIDAFRDDM